MLPSAAAILLAAAAALARAEAPDGAGERLALDLWAEASGGLDTNPRRLAGAEGGEAYVAALARGRLRWAGEGARLVATLAEAGRLYPGARQADALASRLEVAARLPLPAGLALDAEGRASDLTERGGAFDRDALRAEGRLGWEGKALGLSLAGGWSLFAPRAGDLRPFRSRGPEGWLRATLRPADGHRLLAAAGVEQATFPGWAALGAFEPTRDDTAFTGSLEWSWSGWALCSAGYAFTRNASTARGGDFDRHRATLRAAGRLGEEATLALRAALQWTRYPDPLFAGAEQRLAEGREAQDLVEARLARALSAGWELALTAAWTRADGGAGVRATSRFLGGLALGWRSRAD